MIVQHDTCSTCHSDIEITVLSDGTEIPTKGCQCDDWFGPRVIEDLKIDSVSAVAENPYSLVEIQDCHYESLKDVCESNGKIVIGVAAVAILMVVGLIFVL